MRLIAIFLILSFFIAGCSRVETYTYKRDRVDQNVKQGNRGYLAGTPPPAASREGLKRTMFGADIEIPLLPWEKDEVSIPPQPKEGTVEVPPKEDEKTIFEMPEQKSDKDTSGMKTKRTVQVKGETVDEDEWVK